MNVVIVAAVGILAVACDRTPTAPSRPPFAGFWTGPVQQMSCTDWDPRTCGRSYPADVPVTVQLTLEQAARVVTGRFQMDVAPTAPMRVPAWPARRYVGSVEGSVENDGTLVLQGATMVEGSPSFEIRDWSSTQTVDGALTGRFVFYSAPTPASFGSTPLVIRYELLGLRR